MITLFLFFDKVNTKNIYKDTSLFLFVSGSQRHREIHYEMEMSQSLSVTNVWSLANGTVMSLKWVLDKVPIDLLISLLQVLWDFGRRKSIGWLKCAILILSYTCKNCIWLIKSTIQKHCLQKFIMEWHEDHSTDQLASPWPCHFICPSNFNLLEVKKHQVFSDLIHNGSRTKRKGL